MIWYITLVAKIGKENKIQKYFPTLKRRKPVSHDIQAFLAYCFGAELTIL